MRLFDKDSQDANNTFCDWECTMYVCIVDISRTTIRVLDLQFTCNTVILISVFVCWILITFSVLKKKDKGDALIYSVDADATCH